MGEIIRKGNWQWDYSEGGDILNVHKNRVKIHISEEVGPDITIDYNTEGRIVGFEILHASEFLEKDGFTVKDLERIDDAKFEVVQNGAQIVLSLKAGKKEQKVLIPTVLLEAQV